MSRACIAGVGIAVLFACEPSIESAPVTIAEQAWIDPDAEPVAVLTTEPQTCLNKTSQSVLTGELLFNSPLLLGGQAAKAELHCGACHRNGRDNPQFVFTGVSGVAGTADVTHGLFSPDRADDIFNPVEIPDLARASGQVKVDRKSPGLLEAFLHAQIVEEFEGTAPSDAVVNALADYIRALDETTCKVDGVKPVSWRDEIRRVEAGLQMQASEPDLDAETTRSINNAIRSALGRVYDRYAHDDHVQVRDALMTLSRAIASGAAIAELQSQLAVLVPQLEVWESTSYYDADSLRRALLNQH